MDKFILLTFNGFSRGAVYAAFALALVLIWRSARIVNFAQGAMAVATGYLAYSVTNATGSYWAGFAAALVGGLLIGALVERGLMRFIDHSAHLNGVVVALGVVLVITAVVGMIYGGDFLGMQKPFSENAFFVGDIAVLSPYALYVIGAVAAMVIGLTVLFNKTNLGLKMRASAFAPDVSRLLGVNVAGMLTLGWALAAGAGALAGILIMPAEQGVHPHAMDVVFISAFTAAVVGGLDSAVGAVIGGVVVGLLVSYAAGYVEPNITPIAILALLLVVLLLKPGGLFSAGKERTV